MSRLVEFQDAVVEHIKTVLKPKTCEAYAGQFTPEDGRRISFTAPAVFVGLAASDQVIDQKTGELWLPMDVVVFCIAGGGRRDKRADSAAAMAESLVPAVYCNDFGLDFANRAGLPRIENRYVASLDAKGLAMWTVRWDQAVALGDNAWDGDGVAPTEIYIGVAPRVGPEHLDDYSLIEGDAS